MIGPRFVEAVAYAAEAHAGQVRKQTSIPFLAHLLAVAAIALEDGADEDVAIAALLHDVAEDAGGEARLDDVRVRFGERVAAIVAGCSDTFETPKPPWRARKEAYLAHLETADEDVLRVSLADKVHNARAIVLDYELVGDELWGRFNPDSDQLWYYRSLAEVFERRRPGVRAGELRQLVGELATVLEQS